MEFGLKLSNQVCFPIYAASRLIIREYQPYLEELGITYPQYLVLLVLWEQDELSVNEIKDKLILNTNTVTPLLQRMETMGLLERKRSKSDERKVIVSLTEKGQQLQNRASLIPQKLTADLSSNENAISELIDLKEKLYFLINHLQQKNKED